MKLLSYLMVLLLLVVSENIQAENKLKKTDANIVGHVVSYGKHIPYVNISIKGTTIGTVTDETGHYQLVNMPEGDLIIVVSSVGYKTMEKSVKTKKGLTVEVKFDLEPDILGLDEVVVTGSRNEKKRTDAPVIVNSIIPELFVATQSVTLGEGLNFTPGLRTETNCSNCGFTQVRMNGMEGPYSQILINGRAIFSGLASVYGLELIPSNIVDKIEVVRGGGSAIYGSNAIAGTINLILKDPIANSYEASYDFSLIGIGIEGSGLPAEDHVVKFNATVVSDDFKTGVSVYGFNRKKDWFDANGDGFSEMAMMDNTTIGSRISHRFGYRSKIALDFFHIEEERRGGNKFDYLPHEADIAEAIDHKITSAAATYDQFFREYDKMSVYFSGQKVDRGSYYGSNKALNAYGQTNDITVNTGLVYKALFGKSTLTSGLEYTGSELLDIKLGYFDYENAIATNDITGVNSHIENTIVSNQIASTIGLFTQYEFELKKLDISLGGRLDRYHIEDLESSNRLNENLVFSPRINFLYDLLPNIQARTSYSQGYRAPQIFDEDLHIETSGARRVVHTQSDDLIQETSHSFMASLEYNTQIYMVSFNVLAEGFYTILENPFANEFGAPDEFGNVIYVRTNAENGAVIQGINTEITIIPSEVFNFSTGFTFQKSEYKEAQEFNETKFFRTPNLYGFAVLDWDFVTNACLSFSSNYTGKMLIPYFGTTLANPNLGELRESKPFLVFGTNIRYNVKLNGASFQLFGGIKNILNAYQNDFDAGINRDPGYIYGPGQPRTIYFGLKLGNLLK